MFSFVRMSKISFHEFSNLTFFFNHQQHQYNLEILLMCHIEGVRRILQGLGYSNFSVIENHYVNALFRFSGKQRRLFLFCFVFCFVFYHSFFWLGQGWAAYKESECISTYFCKCQYKYPNYYRTSVPTNDLFQTH